MNLLQIAFIAVLGATCLATYATSETLHMPDAASVQALSAPAPSSF